MKPAQLVVTFLLLVFLSTLLISCGGARVTKDQVTQEITQNLPVGSDYSTIRHYLERHKIEHSWVEKEKRFYAIIRNTGGDFLVQEDIQIIIYVDTERKLKSIVVRSVFTGP